MNFLFTSWVMLVLKNKSHVSALGCCHGELGSLLAVSQSGSGGMDRRPRARGAPPSGQELLPGFLTSEKQGL